MHRRLCGLGDGNVRQFTVFLYSALKEGGLPYFIRIVA